jgi:hypothetical protein
MRKNFFVKTMALVVCLAFIGVAGSGLFAAERNVSKVDFRFLFQKPIQFLISIFPSFDSIFGAKKNQVLAGSTATSSGIVKPTGDLVIGRPSVGD